MEILVTTFPWEGSTWQRVCAECFSGDEAKMLQHASAYLQADPNNVPSALHLGKEFRDIIGARNRRQWWTTARDALLERAARIQTQEGNAGDPDAQPLLVGRGPEGEEVRAQTRLHARSRQQLVGGSTHSLMLELFASEGHGERGGYVLRLRLDHEPSSLLPAVRLLPDGLELHVAGEAEGEALLNVMHVLTQFCRPSPWPTAAMGATSFETVARDVPRKVP